MLKIVLSAVSLLTTMFAYGQSSTLKRSKDPVVISGASLSSFSSLNPADIVGFKYVQGVWTQIPIQVDERAWLDIVTPYGPIASITGSPLSSANPKIYFYCDATTYTGADPTPTFDNDDELVFMVKDAGGQFTGTTYPVGVVTGTKEQITITDPLGGVGYVYLFQNAGSLEPSAGLKYVNYSSNLTSTTGFPANKTGVNTENTTISTANYSWHFSAEWVSDELKLLTGNNTDILDRYKNFFADGKCIRDEDIFSGRENAYVTCKAGPVRVIRSYMGAVSGPFTQRTHFFYEGRQDVATDLRVHNIASIYDAFDYNPAANNMIYRNNLNPNGVIINGTQDKITRGDIAWEQVSGTPGTISIVHSRATNLTAGEAVFTSYYDDNKKRAASNCTGDGQAWGTSGVGINFLNGNVCTDPLESGCGVSSPYYRTLQTRMSIYADAANMAATTASAYTTKFNNPLIVSSGAVNTVAGSSVASARKEFSADLSIDLASDFNVYPNPAKSLVSIRYSLHEDQEVSIIFNDLMGRSVIVKKIKAVKGENEAKLDLSPLKKGVYFINFYKDNLKHVNKLIVE